MDPQQFATVINPASIIDTSIIDLLGIQGATDDQKQQIIDDALATIHTRILARILDSIPEPEQASFDQLIDSGDNEKVKLYLIQKGIDMTRIASEEALNYKVELVGLVKDNAHNQHTVQPSVAPQQPAPQPQPTTSAQSAVTQPLSQQNVASPQPTLPAYQAQPPSVESTSPPSVLQTKPTPQEPQAQVQPAGGIPLDQLSTTMQPPTDTASSDAQTPSPLPQPQPPQQSLNS